MTQAVTAVTQAVTADTQAITAVTQPAQVPAALGLNVIDRLDKNE